VPDLPGFRRRPVDPRPVGVCSRCGGSVILDPRALVALCDCGTSTITREFFDVAQALDRPQMA
jgi:hypothetical protein